MRTTVTLDPDVETLLRRLMREGGLSFKDAVNSAIRAGAGGREQAEPFRTPSFRMGEPKAPLEKALRLAGELEDADLGRRLAARK